MPLNLTVPRTHFNVKQFRRDAPYNLQIFCRRLKCRSIQGDNMASFFWLLWGIIMVFGVLFWRRYPPGHEFRRYSLIAMVVATCVLPTFAISLRRDPNRQAERGTATQRLDNLQRAWGDNHPRP